MIRRIRSVEDLGGVVRATRNGADMTQQQAAALAGVGARFLGELERGKPGVRLGLVLRVVGRFGLELWVVPRGAMEEHAG